MTATALEVGQPAVDQKAPEEDDQVLWSVTTILGILDKPALQYWAAEQTAIAAVRDLDAWQAIERSSGTVEAVDWLKKARYRTPKGETKSAELGTQVHEAAEQYALTGNRPDTTAEVAPYIDQWEAWCDRFQPEFLATEVTVYNEQYGYAGTGDGFMRLDGKALIFDYKTSKKTADKKGNPPPVYPETALQVAAYRHAEFAALWRPRRFEEFRRRYYLLGAGERALAVEVPRCDGGLGIKITPESCIAYPLRCDADVFERFLYILEAARWVLGTPEPGAAHEKNAVGPPLVAPDPEPAT